MRRFKGPYLLSQLTVYEPFGCRVHQKWNATHTVAHVEPDRNVDLFSAAARWFVEADTRD
jgi:hypothetical protein